MRLRLKVHAGESAQVLPMMVMLLIVLVGMLGLATDLSRIYVARAQLGRSVDAAALAGAKQLPSTTLADSTARAYIAENEPGANIAVTISPNSTSLQVGVTATKTVRTIFMKMFGISSVDVSNDALAGYGVLPLDAVMVIDNTASMGDPPCTSPTDNTTSGCPIREAKVAATNFTNTLLPGTNTVVGVTGFRGCYKPSGTASSCVATTTIGSLNATATNVTSKIGLMDGIGGSGTNVCGGLDMGSSVLLGTGSHSASNTIRVIVILSDGDNNYNSVSYVSGSPGAPVVACRPIANSTCPTGAPSNCDPSSSDASPTCGAGQPRERQLDKFTRTRADQIKTGSQPAEIYVVGFGVCGSEDSSIASTSYCANIGNADVDTVADQRLLKCVASSSAGTNDHYFRANAATDLPSIFSTIAQQIAFRLIK